LQHIAVARVLYYRFNALEINQIGPMSFEEAAPNQTAL
jgi:hypothetical protein